MSGADFLLELRSEEIPARMQAGARADLERLFRAEMEAAGVAVGEVTVWSTPRRLALIARDLPDATEAVSEEAKGPPEGAPDAAIEGFCRKAGVSRDQLELRDVKGRNTYFAVIDKPGRATRHVLAGAIPAIVRAFPWPKSMRWGEASLSTESLRWVRPLSGIVAILGEDLVECEVGPVVAGYATMGHRFHCNRPITIGGAHDYAEKLRACHVIVDHAERQDLIRLGAAQAASEAGLTLVADEGLVIENAGLTEWPVPLLGRFDAAHLDVPPEVIQLTARTNQKYFVCNSAEGKLANAFVCTANIEAADGGAAIVDGNRKVLAARLSDARFFWEQDRKTPLADHAKKLERITFHEKLGTVAHKVERVAKLARWLVEEGIVNPPRNGEGDHAQHGGGAPAAGETSPGSANPPVPLHHAAHGPPPPAGEDRARLADVSQLADWAEQAARLAKADLVTEMVGEFPELQGLMGGYYARAEGLPPQVADAIRDHYKPVGQGDEVPTAPVTVAVSLADKFDSFCSLFSFAGAPTGSKDPFALRRSAIAILNLIIENDLEVEMERVVAQTIEPVWWMFFENTIRSYQIYPILRDIQIKQSAGISRVDIISEINSLENEEERERRKEAFLDFERDKARIAMKIQDDVSTEKMYILDRLEQLLISSGLDQGVVITSITSSPTRSAKIAKALQDFLATEDGANLLAGYKRAANILKKEDWHGLEGEIARTGEEDPLALVDDPDLRAVVDAKMAQRHAKELSYTPEPDEKALIGALDTAEPRAAAAVEAEDFAAAMAALASLRAPIDRFFESVTVNDADPARRAARLDLLARFRDAVHRVADFGRIEG